MQNKKLFRNTDNKIIAGVCSGLADYFEIDPTIIRLAFIALAMVGGVGFSLYIILAIIVPPINNLNASPKDNIFELFSSLKYQSKNIKKDFKYYDHQEDDRKDKIIRRKTNIGVIIIIIGFLLLLQNFVPSTVIWFLNGLLWPIIIILLGVYLIRKK